MGGRSGLVPRRAMPKVPLTQDGLEVILGGANELDGEVVHQHLQHIGG